MKNNDIYKGIAESGIRLPSSMAVFPAGGTIDLSEERVLDILGKCEELELKGFDDGPEDYQAEKAMRVLVEYKDTEYEVTLLLLPNDMDLSGYDSLHSIDEEHIRTARNQKYYLECILYFDGKAIDSYHLQIKLLMALVPDACLLADLRIYRLLSPKWAEMTAVSPTPPSPDYLYAIHYVYDGNEENPLYWFHTHGLTRCGTVDLEMLNFSGEPKTMGDMIQMTARKFIEDPAAEGESFAVAYDGSGINMAWLRWEDALARFPENILGGLSDRYDKDTPNMHADPSGILFGVDAAGEFVSPEILAKKMGGDPIYFISNEETDRMSALARERYPYFRVVFNTKRYANGIEEANEEGKYDWTFMVKLGLPIDCGSENEREHLWFEVLSLANDTIEARLINQPYKIEALDEGDVGTYGIDCLTDWLIYSPDTVYTTDSIYQLVM